tara:strand:+ start:83 stop:418 length:336 start_codon:yes stop_codon:yes gene_type:complete
MRRKAITDRMKLERLLLISEIMCFGCYQPIIAGEKVEWDHAVPLALGGRNTPFNIRPLHKACHALKTRGLKATTLNSDIHTIAKVKRMEKKRLGTAKEKPKRAWPKRKMAT